uniref:Uncharacterized protein n=1 Tax=Picea glauca TaxID=3330 RepID=A0A117NG29_PICGL|nr:hypothetical protein ABT39_MTgene1953 [Picea glauca]QHR92449.1 hypothetical protein Q903MT_gene6495 [Picea sitchensis]
MHAWLINCLDCLGYSAFDTQLWLLRYSTGLIGLISLATGMGWILIA